MKYRTLALVLALLLLPALTLAQRTAPPSEAELAEITARGKALHAYDLAAWQGSDAVLATKPDTSLMAVYVARQTDDSWVVAFGRIGESGEHFLVAYEAVRSGSSNTFKVRQNIPPREDTGFFFFAAKSIQSALKDFKTPTRPYNTAVLPAPDDRMYVYLLPAQTDSDVYPLGGDVRYLFSSDGETILEKRRLHNSITEFQKGNLEKVEASFHTAVLDDIPEDSDVFHVLARKPAVPEWVASRKYLYMIEVDGRITYVGETDKVLNTRENKDAKPAESKEQLP